MVRRDTSGAMMVAVAQSVEDGRELLALGRLVMDGAQYASWRAARWRWARETLGILSLQFEPEAIEEFVRANSASGETWEDRLCGELRATHSAIELLRSLAGTLGS